MIVDERAVWRDERERKTGGMNDISEKI